MRYQFDYQTFDNVKQCVTEFTGAVFSLVVSYLIFKVARWVGRK